ncbi:MAG: hypothetical protein KBT69_09005 [Oceanihabitans sp.]|nr:hypothetical protein [Oceanihabitans sp.]
MKKIIFLFIITLSTTSTFSQNESSNKKEMDAIQTKLETLFMQDQLFRRLYQDAEKKFGVDSAEMDYFWNVAEAQDKRIEQELLLIIDKYGWLGTSQVGRLANGAIWSVIQHSSLDIKEKYAPLMKVSVLQNESQAMQYARLIDRMFINDNKPQVYGSQTTNDKDGNSVFFEIGKPEFINKRRKEIGLEPIEDFAKERGIAWDIPQKEE